MFAVCLTQKLWAQKYHQYYIQYHTVTCSYASHCMKVNRANYYDKLIIMQ